MGRFNNVDSIYNVSYGDYTMGFMDQSKIDVLKSGSSSGSVLTGMEYRPDKVAEYYLGSSSLAWAINLVNCFEDGIKDYYLGRSIIIPSISQINLIV